MGDGRCRKDMGGFGEELALHAGAQRAANRYSSGFLYAASP